MTATFGLALIVLAAVLQAGFLMRRENRRDPVSHWLLAAAAVLLLATLVDRSVRSRFVAVTTAYELLVFLSAIICVVLYALRMARQTRGLSPFVLFGATIVCLALLLISSSPIAPRDILPAIPALRSLWLVLHIVFTFIGEAFFAVSFVAAIAFLAFRDENRRADMDRLMAVSIGIGYPVFTAGALVFGAVWARTVWGSWWSWNSREALSLVTWLIYTAYLLTRMARRMSGKLPAAIAIIGFAAMLFTIFEVSSLVAGLHSEG